MSMKTVAILGGLGSQMFKYAFFLQLKENASDICYISMVPFRKMEMWNGYELDTIFNIQEMDMMELLSAEKREQLEKSEKNYAECILNAMQEYNPQALNYHIVRGKPICWNEDNRNNYSENILKKISNKLKWYLFKIGIEKSHVDYYQKKYLEYNGNVLYDEFNHTSDKYLKGRTYDLRKVFRFPEFIEQRDVNCSEEMLRENSVALHVRRGDHLYDNGNLFSRKYFNKATKYIREKVGNPHFYIFSEDSEWCREHSQEIGLYLQEDKVTYVDWHNGEQSFRDMQLMTFCKHNILVISSFSWWGYYLSKHSDKIVCAPKGYWFEVKKHF